MKQKLVMVINRLSRCLKLTCQFIDKRQTLKFLIKIVLAELMKKLLNLVLPD